MSFDTFTEAAARKIGRRRFLGLLGAGTIAATVGEFAAATSASAATYTFTFINNSGTTLWIGALGNSLINNGGWAMASGQTTTLSVPGTWSGRFWARTYCTFNSAGQGSCETGDCGGVLECNGAGGQPPVSLAEITLGNGSGDNYDVSYVDGFNVPFTFAPVSGTGQCTVAGCTVNLLPDCPAALQEIDSSGRIIACRSACNAFGTDQYCCAGAYDTPATCIPSQWPVDYAAYFKSSCPNAYSYAYDDATSDYTCTTTAYTITFAPISSSGGGGTTVPSAPTGLAASGTTSSSTTLSWTGSSGATGYYVLRNGASIATVTSTSYTNTGLAASTTYTYEVEAYNSAGTSAGSNTVSVTTSASSGSGGGTCTTTATSNISADCYSASQGTITISASGDSNPSGVDGNQAAQLSNGDWLEYENINFGSGGSTQFNARVASGATGGVSGLIEVGIGSPTNIVGSFSVGNTGGWSTWTTVPANISKVTGTQNVYLVFSSSASGNPPFASLHYFSFPAT